MEILKKVFRDFLLSLLLLLKISLIWGQKPFDGMEELFAEPKHYIATYTSAKPIIDGEINEQAWKEAQWTDFFVDIEGNKKALPIYKTRIKMLWNDSSLLIAAEMEEPHVWATLQDFDQIIYHDNDFEVFIDPDNDTHRYYEIEINALNTIFDLFLIKPYRNGGDANIKWNLSNLKSAIKVQGTLNDPSDVDKGWSVEMAIPFHYLKNDNEVVLPKIGSLWRINFSRVEWEVDIDGMKYIKRKDNNGRPLPENNWVWSPQGLINMHFPERWGYLLFSGKKADSKFSLPFDEKQRNYLWLIYYKQKKYIKDFGFYSKSLKDLRIDKEIQIDGVKSKLSLESKGGGFIATIVSQSGSSLNINEDGLIRITK